MATYSKCVVTKAVHGVTACLDNELTDYISKVRSRKDDVKGAPAHLAAQTDTISKGGGGGSWGMSCFQTQTDAGQATALTTSTSTIVWNTDCKYFWPNVRCQPHSPQLTQDQKTFSLVHIY